MLSKPVKRKGKKTSRQAAVRRADKAFSEYIRARDGGVCVMCGKRENLTCGHVFSRAHYGTRWDELNAFCQCTGCNLRHEYDPYPFIEYASFRNGRQTMTKVHSAFVLPTKYTTSEILDIESRFKQKLEELNK